MNRWLDKAVELVTAGEPATLVTVAGVRGSAPREIGTRMLVTRDETIGTIGGGQLEYRCTRIGWELLQAAGKGPAESLRRFPLGADCGQCCGGVVDVLFEELGSASTWIHELRLASGRGEPVVLISWPRESGGFHRFAMSGSVPLPEALRSDPAVADVVGRARADGRARRIGDRAAKLVLVEPMVTSDFDIAVFGAGHVGTAAVALLGMLDANVRWIDSRSGFLPDRVPDNVQTLCSSEPAREVAALPANSYFLVLTHSHPLDYEICRAVLARGDFAYLGLIGSRSKRRRFEKRFAAEGVTGVDRLRCPIGIAGISGKKPAEIALAVTAELLQLRDAPAAAVELGCVRRASRRSR